MSWLADLEYIHKYLCSEGHDWYLKCKASEDPLSHIDCPKCNEKALYQGFAPQEIKQTNVVEYDKNGRKAVRIRDKNGELHHYSKTKLKWLKTGRVENQYTPEYQEHLEKTKQEQLLKADQSGKKGRGSVSSRVQAEDLLKNMPDGEYVSDGVNIMPAPKKQA